VALGNINATLIARLLPGETIWDGGHRSALVGFGVRRQRRHAVYIVKARLHGQQRFMTIGRHGRWTPVGARREAKRLLGLIASGRDPAAGSDAPTLGAATQQFLERQVRCLRPRSLVEVTRHLLVYAKPLHGLRITKLDRRAIAARLSAIETANGASVRNRVRASLSTLFRWCIHEGWLDLNPVTATAKAADSPSRDRVLADAEIKALWGALRDDQFGAVFKLLLLTAQRRTEIGNLRWDEIDFDRALIVLPPERTKNKRRHEIPLSVSALAILQAQPRISGRDFVFGFGGRAGFANWDAAKQDLSARAKLAAPWRLHDLRRTAATRMIDLGVLPHIVEAVLNHYDGHRSGVAQIYNRSEYGPQKADALSRWADALLAIVDCTGT
jgi:integrase